MTRGPRTEVLPRSAGRVALFFLTGLVCFGLLNRAGVLAQDSSTPLSGVVSEAPSEPTDPSTTEPEPLVMETSATVESIIGGFLPVESGQAPLREMDETPALNIFADPTIVKRILYGRKPFRYNAKGRPDPMIIPWVRVEVLSTEHIAQARQYLKEAETLTDPEARKKRYMLAIEELDRVIQMNPTSKYGKEARALRNQVRALITKIPPPGATPTPVKTKPPELPPWVVANTKAIIYDQSPKHNHLVLVGDSVLRLGDTVPKYPGVKLVEINRDSVVYEFKGIRIPVIVEVPIKQE